MTVKKAHNIIAKLFGCEKVKVNEQAVGSLCMDSDTTRYYVTVYVGSGNIYEYHGDSLDEAVASARITAGSMKIKLRAKYEQGETKS